MRLNTGALIAATVLNGALVAIGRGSFVHTVVVIALVGYLAVPAFVIVTVTFLARRQWQPAKQVSHIAWSSPLWQLRV
jgi:glucose-6-phosphate-specific signal transduction histidine kinase